LLESIRARIRSEGPITFADFMDMALYDRTRGFFSGSPVGSHFVTSPHVSLLFASLLAEQFRELLRPGDILVDLGAGDGTLLDALRRLLDVQCVAVEQSAAARAAAAARGLEVVASVDELEPFAGVALANELLDNVPFHRLRPGPVEVFVGLDGDRLVEVEMAPSIPVHDEHAPEWTVSPRAHGLIGSICERMHRGYVFVIDYGFVAGEQPEPVRGYRGHRLERDVLAAPGSMDVTGPVDLDAIARAGREAAFDVFGPVRQRDALRNLGLAGALERMRRIQAEHESKGRWREAVGILSARTEAAVLADPTALGSHHVLVLATRGSPAPRATMT